MQDALTHAPATVDHVHPDVSIDTAFDFLNTVELEDGAPVERLTSLADAAAWFAEHGIVDDAMSVERIGGTGAGEATLTRIIGTRTALRDVAQAVARDEPPSRPAVDAVNQALRSRPRVELVDGPDGVRLGHSHVGDAVDDILARIAEPIVRAIGSGQDDRIRICASDTCRWIFFDESRTGQRRWCNMKTCGNQAKARRHRERQRARSAESPA
jgi:predicted RNA-binding Zn ribbon-like protein